MAEKIVIAQLELNTASLVKEAAETKKTLDQLKASQKALNTETQAGREESVKIGADIKNLNAQYRSQQNVIASLISSNGELLKSNEAITIGIDKQVNSIAEARKNNSELLKIRNELNLNSKEGLQAAEQINKKLDENNAFIKTNVSELEKQKLGIGGYADAIKEAFGGQLGLNQGIAAFNQGLTALAPAFASIKSEISLIVNGFKAAKEETIGLSSAQKAAAITTSAVSSALKVLKIALIATGIGAILVLLGSLIAFLTSTQSGIDKVTSVTRPLAAIFQTLGGILQKLGEALFDAFTNPKKAIDDIYNFIKDQVITTFNALSKILEGIATLNFSKVKEGFNDLGDQARANVAKISGAVKDLSDQLVDAAKRGAEVDRIQKEIEKREISIGLQREKALDAIKEQELIAKNASIATDEREKAAKEAIRLAKEQSKAEQEILDLKIRSLEISQLNNDTDREAQKELSDLRAQRVALDRQAKERELSFVGEIAAAEQARAAAAKKATEERVNLAISNLELELRIDRESRALRVSTIADIEADAKKEVDILNAKLEAKKISELQYQADILAIENNVASFKAKVEEDELKRIEDFNNRKRELEERLRIAAVEDETERELLRTELDFAKRERELETLQLNEGQKTELLLLIEQERQNAIEDIKTKSYEQQQKAAEQAAQKEIAFQQTVNNERIQLTKQFFGIIQGLFGDSLAARIAGIALEAALEAGRVKVNTAAAQAINLANANKIPFPGNIAASITAGIQNAKLQAQSIGAIAKIFSGAAINALGTAVRGRRFEQGGITSIDGKSHAQGGVPIYAGNKYIGEAEGNEGIGILNKAAFASFMKYNNQFAKGRIGTGFAQNGGIMSTAIGNNNGNISELLKSMPAPIVYVEDIKTGIVSDNDIRLMANV